MSNPMIDIIELFQSHGIEADEQTEFLMEFLSNEGLLGKFYTEVREAASNGAWD